MFDQLFKSVSAIDRHTKAPLYRERVRMTGAQIVPCALYGYEDELMAETDQATQAHLRKMVVQAVRGGMTRVEAGRTFGVSLRAIGNWMKSAREGGLRALRPGKRGRRREAAT